MAGALTLHVLAAIIWVGGMFFAHVILRPSALPLEPPVRLALWRRVLPRFFAWVWFCVAILLVTGFGMAWLDFGGSAAFRAAVLAMAGLGVVMSAIFVFIFVASWPRFRRAVEAADWPGAAARLATIRLLVTINLTLGLVTSAIGAIGLALG